jgi:hypothetical protein
LLRDKLVDNSFIAHPLLRAIEENGGLIKVSGGSRVECPSSSVSIPHHEPGPTGSKP